MIEIPTSLYDDGKRQGLSRDEVEMAVKILARLPNATELGMISAMWSEHCSYKSSRVHLSRFPTTGARVLEGPGENAGVVDIGEGLACVFKMESHNHPSYIEPYQGAATGVGGILRDVFTMGARPVASLNSLRFGETSHPRMRHLISGVVAGIGDYGNCMGIPTVGGETFFHPSYNGNILVNAFTLGLVKSDRYFKASASGVGNSIIYVGSRTGRDGIHGATMASDAFASDDPQAQEKRPTVQVGDPFTEKLLLEACLELMQKDCIIGIQDMGAAGLTSSSFEMAGRAGSGVVLDLDKVPTREERMTPYELMLSESQERMLIVVKRGTEKEVEAIFKKWDLQAAHVGEVNSDGHVTLRFHGEQVAKLPALPLAQNAPKYNRPMARPAYLDATSKLALNFPDLTQGLPTLKRLVGSPNLCSRQWIYQQYDQSVRTNTLQTSGGDAAVVRVKESKAHRALAMSADVNPRYVYLDPFWGAAHAVAESCRNLACVGAQPIGLTDCLNFGNPEHPEVMWQFAQSIDGMSEACRKLSLPVVSGNVSFYNETDGKDIHPTPSVVAVGLIDDFHTSVKSGFQHEGDVIVLMGAQKVSLGASEYLWAIHGKEQGTPLEIDWRLENGVQRLCREAMAAGLLSSAHDLSDGGLLVALMESSFASRDQRLGFDVETTELNPNGRCDETWFGEGPARIMVSLPENHYKNLADLAQKHGVPLQRLGRVIAGNIALKHGPQREQSTVAELYQAWQRPLMDYMGGAEWPDQSKETSA